MMNHYFVAALGLGLLCGSGGGTFAGQMRPASGALISSASARTLSTALTVDADTREFTISEAVTRVDAVCVMGRVGTQVAPWLHIEAGLGWTQAEVDYHQGAGALAWLVGARLAVLEQIVESSPVAGTLQSWGLALETEYKSSESSIGLTELEWYEVTVAPLLHYTVNRGHAGEAGALYVPRTALTLGVLFSHIDGDRNGTPLHNNRDFAYVAGGEAMLQHDWVGSLRVVVFGGHDRTLRFAFGRYF
jgi:hypothetical protein